MSDATLEMYTNTFGLKKGDCVRLRDSAQVWHVRHVHARGVRLWADIWTVNGANLSAAFSAIVEKVSQ